MICEFHETNADTDITAPKQDVYPCLPFGIPVRDQSRICDQSTLRAAASQAVFNEKTDSTDTGVGQIRQE